MNWINWKFPSYTGGMYLGIDVGGTKTLLAVFDEAGRIVHEHRFPSNPRYKSFLKELDEAIKTELSDHQITAASCAIAGFEINRETGVVPELGNLPWKNVQLEIDLEKVLSFKVYVENDAKLAALSEALLVREKFKNVLYITIGTGIGIAQVVDGQIRTRLSDKGGRGLVLEYDGKLMDWDDIASGKALVRRFGKHASEITDKHIWAEFSADIARGLIHFVEEMRPDVVIVGGGVGSHFDRFGLLLNLALQSYETEHYKMPEAIMAKRPEEAVIYGCYDYIRQKIG